MFWEVASYFKDTQAKPLKLPQENPTLAESKFQPGWAVSSLEFGFPLGPTVMENSSCCPLSHGHVTRNRCLDGLGGLVGRVGGVLLE